MKNILKWGLLLLVASLMTACSASQKNKKIKVLEEGHITYAILVADDADSLQNFGTMEIYFSENFVKKITDIGGITKIELIVDNVENKGLVLTDVLGDKTATKLTGENLDAKSKNSPNYGKVVYTEKHKEIAGVQCQEVYVTTADTTIEPVTVYVADFQLANFAKIDLEFKDLKGFPLSWKVIKMGKEMIVKATKVSLSKQDNKIFSLEIPEGYKEAKED